MHLPPPNLPRFGGGERPPFSCKPIAPLTITMGQRPCTLQAANWKYLVAPCPLLKGGGLWGRINKYFKVGGLRFLQALTPRERHPRFLIACPSGPLSRHRERGWGEREDTPVATLGAILCAVRIDFGLPSKINPYPAQPATGVLGQSPKRVLVWGPRRDTRPAGERRSGGALEGYPKRKRGDPTWSKARDDAHE